MTKLCEARKELLALGVAREIVEAAVYSPGVAPDSQEAFKIMDFRPRPETSVSAIGTVWTISTQTEAPRVDDAWARLDAGIRK